MKNIKKYIPYTLKRFLRKYIFPLPEIQNLSIKQREIKLKEFYKLKTGQELDLDNPQLFTEKLQWLKLYYKHPDLRRCVDKADFKDYVKEKLGGGILRRLFVYGINLNRSQSGKFQPKSLF